MAKKFNISGKYLNFVNIVLNKLAAELLKRSNINEHLINLKRDKQPLYGLIYSFKLVELKTLKTYIKTNLANNFIRPFKSPTRAIILFIKMLDGRYHLCENYLEFNDLSVKN